MSIEQIPVSIKLLEGADNTAIPEYMSEHAAGMDIRAAVRQPVNIGSQECAAIPTGFAIALPPGFEAQIRPRSGLALKHGITVVNSPGTIDADYRGEVKVLLINHGNDVFTVEPGMRIAQMVLASVPRTKWKVVDRLPPTERGDGGMGHSGM